MAYDDGYFYGQCKIICEAETLSDNGKAVTITDGSRSWSGTIANKICAFLVPGRGQYTITLVNTEEETEWSGVIEAGYGECIHVMLADGYEAIMVREKLTLEEIEASVGSVADYVPDADAVKTLNNNLTANNNAFRFGYDSVNDQYGYYREVDGADTLVPFSSGGGKILCNFSVSGGAIYNDTFTIEQDGFLFAFAYGYGGSSISHNGTVIASKPQGGSAYDSNSTVIFNHEVKKGDTVGIYGKSSNSTGSYGWAIVVSDLE